MVAAEITYDKKSKTLRRKTPFSETEMVVGSEYAALRTSSDPEKVSYPVVIEDVIDDMVLVRTVGGKNNDKKRLLSFEQVFRDYGKKEPTEIAKNMGNPDMVLGINTGPTGQGKSAVARLLAAQERTNQLLERLLAVWEGGKSTNGVGHK